MRLYIFRHGETFANVEKLVSDGHSPKVQLTPLGREQATKLGEELSPQNLPIIYASPYDRALQTAELVAAPHHTPITVLDDLREFSFGLTEGWSEAETFAKYNDEFNAVLNVGDEQTYQVRLPQGETKQEALQRFINVLEYIKQNCPYDKAGVATHGHIMSIYFYHLYHQVHGFKNCEYMILDI